MKKEPMNVCKFVPTKTIRNEINLISFVYERLALTTEMKMTAVYSAVLVTSGSGILHTAQKGFKLCRGDIFFKLPARQYAIENCGELNYIYISYEGIRSRELLERMHFDEKSPVYHGFDKLIPFWEEAVETVADFNIDLRTESVLLYTVSCICFRFSGEGDDRNSRSGMLYIKQYVDEHFTDCTLTLQSVSDLFLYNYKYASKAFVRMTGMYFHDYINEKRMLNAKKLIDNGFISVKEVAHMSGFSDALYFSKLFKKSYGVLPSEYIKSMQNGTDDIDTSS